MFLEGEGTIGAELEKFRQSDLIQKEDFSHKGNICGEFLGMLKTKWQWGTAVSLPRRATL